MNKKNIYHVCIKIEIWGERNFYFDFKPTKEDIKKYWWDNGYCANSLYLSINDKGWFYIELSEYLNVSCKILELDLISKE